MKYPCPNCGNRTVTRSGPHFEDERRCLTCGHCYDPDKVQESKEMVDELPEVKVGKKKERCPKCGQDYVLGLVVGFWAEVNLDPMEVRLEKASLITSKRQCYICDHRWDAGEIVEETG